MKKVVRLEKVEKSPFMAFSSLTSLHHLTALGTSVLRFVLVGLLRGEKKRKFGHLEETKARKKEGKQSQFGYCQKGEQVLFSWDIVGR